MFTLLAEEMFDAVLKTPAQLDRYNRAVAECDGYTYEDRSWIYKEAACSVVTLSGNRYLVFNDQCTCPDWTKRCWGSEDSPLCKHIIAANLTGNLTEPEGDGGAELVDDDTVTYCPTGEWGIPDDSFLTEDGEPVHYKEPTDEDLTRTRWH